MIRAATPILVESMRSAPLWSGLELHIAESAYDFDPVNLSHDVLAVETKRLITLRAGFTGWNDLGHPARSVAVVKASGSEPWWLHAWQKKKKPSACEAPPRARTAVA